MKRRRLALLVGAAVLVLYAMPSYAAFLAAPAWDVFVVDAKGNPVPNIVVTETWQNYSCESENHTTASKTDAKGQAHFAAIYVHRNPAKCAREAASELTAGVHASLGRHVYVSVDGVICVADSHGYCVDWIGHPEHMTSKVTLTSIPQRSAHLVSSI